MYMKDKLVVRNDVKAPHDINLRLEGMRLFLETM